MAKLMPYLISGLLAVILATAAWAYVEQERREAAEERAAVQERRAITAEAEARAKQDAIDQLADEMRASARRAERYASIRVAVARATDSNACAASAPVRAALDGLRAGGSSGLPAGPGGADAAPRAPGTANRPH